eukprot:scaffold100298_cov65-Phaeocystis_antarctica.AAC.1
MSLFVTQARGEPVKPPGPTPEISYRAAVKVHADGYWTKVDPCQKDAVQNSVAFCLVGGH